MDVDVEAADIFSGFSGTIGGEGIGSRLFGTNLIDVLMKLGIEAEINLTLPE